MKIIEELTNQQLSLTKQNYKAAGGEGEIYKINNKAYKIYFDSAKMLPVGKIKELQRLNSNNIVRPISLLKDLANKYVGYSMNFVDDCVTLCQLFPLSFKQRNNIKIDNINKLIEIMKSIFQEFHKNKMLIVDANEYNFLIHDKQFDNLYLIDVDSCQTPSYPATAIMTSICDYQYKAFTEMSDWFSFAILTFQMYTGLHPFKGKHPKVNLLEDRMRQNLSVYDKKVSVPAFIQNFESLIPKNFNEWYKIIFNSNKRDFPPDSFEGQVIQVLQKVIQKSVQFIIELYEEYKIYNDYKANVISLNNDLCLTEKGLYIGKRLYENIVPYSKFVKVKYNNDYKIYSLIIKGKELKIKNVIEDKIVTCDLHAQYIIEPAKNYKINSEILYIINNDTLLSLKIVSQHELIGVAKLVDLAMSYQVFNNVIIQSVLDTVYIVLLRGIEGVCENIKINELVKQRIVNAELNNNILIVITEQKGKLKRYIIKFGTRTKYYEDYIIFSDEEVSDVDINFIVLDTGVCILSDIDKGLILFRTGFEDKNINIITDEQIMGRKLCSYQNKALYIDENKIYSFKMK